MRIIRLIGDVEPGELTSKLLQEIADRYPEKLSDDDVTVMVVRANGREPAYSAAEKRKALFRIAVSTIRSVFSRSEHAPLPDASMANVPGAIIPALGRRWRAGKSPS